MKLAISNIAWAAEQDNEMYAKLRTLGCTDIEIAPTRIFPEAPYDDLDRAKTFAARLHEQYGLGICSMQSIWYGMPQRIAASPEDRAVLLYHTKKAIRFAEAIGCRNLVFGCPKNRRLDDPSEAAIVERFLEQLAVEAALHGVVIALEANPTIYNTNYINTTAEAIALIRRVGHPSLMLNLDMGTIIENSEDLEPIMEHIDVVSHVHISEPMLKPLSRRYKHKQLRDLLEQHRYHHVVSLEMGRTDDTMALDRSIEYFIEVFG